MIHNSGAVCAKTNKLPHSSPTEVRSPGTMQADVLPHDVGGSWFFYPLPLYGILEAYLM